LFSVLAIKKTIKFVLENVRDEYIVVQDFTKKEFFSLTKTVSQLAKNFVGGIKLTYLKISNSTQKGLKTIANFFDKTAEFVRQEVEERQGMVVIPSTEEDEAVKEKIKKSFSDEVKIKLTDKSSGIITPIFRDGEGEEYMYLLVPVNK